MSEAVTREPIYSVLHKMQADMSEMKFDVRDLKVRMTTVEEHLGGTIIAVSGVNSRRNRMSDRVGRIETRLDLMDAR